MAKVIKTSIWALRAGMVIIKCDRAGVPFSEYGRPLSDAPHHETLDKYGVKDVFIWVDDPEGSGEDRKEFTVGRGDDIPVINIASAGALISEFKRSVALAFDVLRKGSPVGLKKLISAISDMYAINSELHGVLANTLVPKEYDADIEHAAKVCVTSLIIASAMNVKLSDAIDLGIAAIFHDIGFVRVPNKITDKRFGMTPAEVAVMRNHPEYSVQLLAKCGEVNQTMQTIVMQHHELCDCSGYPSQIPERYIHPLAKIISVADTYENLLVGDFETLKLSNRPEAVKFIVSGAGKQYSTDVVKAFMTSVGVLPVGSHVRLSNGMTGIICEQNLSDRMRPKVLVFDADNKSKMTMFNLSKDSSVKIDSAIDVVIADVDPVAIHYEFITARLRATVSH